MLCSLATAEPLCVLIVTPIDFTPCLLVWCCVWQLLDTIIHHQIHLVNERKLNTDFDISQAHIKISIEQGLSPPLTSLFSRKKEKNICYMVSKSDFIFCVMQNEGYGETSPSSDFVCTLYIQNLCLLLYFRLVISMYS